MIAFCNVGAFCNGIYFDGVVDRGKSGGILFIAPLTNRRIEIMKKSNRTALLLAIAFSALLSTGCNGGGSAEKKVEGRFDVIDSFFLLDGADHGAKGKLLKDRKTGKCYLYVWGGSGNGGPAMAPAECG